MMLQLGDTSLLLSRPVTTSHVGKRPGSRQTRGAAAIRQCSAGNYSSDSVVSPIDHDLEEVVLAVLLSEEKPTLLWVRHVTAEQAFD